ncbi:hypothetical protein SDC9_58257 [bioreactor metagenome]|uniref:Uncharacterized protein n=1 Tax=bioreactor metagenome TaxID=1076179 RepID=A0A644X6V2_9ZZZZ
MSRDILKTVRLAAQYFPGSPGTVSDVFQVETQLRVEELFREGLPVAAVYSVILRELPEELSERDKVGTLSIVVDAWRQYRLERGRGE